MMLLRWMCFLMSIAIAYCQMKAQTSLQEKNLHIEEITQIMSRDDPSGTNHSIRVTISEHSPLDNVQNWKFLQHTFEGEFINYQIKGNGENPSLQTEFIFPGNLLDSNSHMLKSTNGTHDLAMEYNVIDIEGLKTHVTWVGEDKEKDSSSLRVAVDNRVGEMSVGESKCNTSRSPCYFIEPQQKQSFRRCINITGDDGSKSMQCDEREKSFNGLTSVPSISLREDRSLEVEFIYIDKILDVEVVAYDPDNTTNIFSTYPYRCKFITGKFWDEGEKMPCRQSLQLPEEQFHMMILVVIVEDGDAKQSTLQFFDTTSDRQLRMDRITKALEKDDATTENYDIEIAISHQTLSNIKTWRLIVHREGTFSNYETIADGSDPSTQNTITFRGTVDGADSIALVAVNSYNKIVARDYMVKDIRDIGSEVAWVGAEKESSISPLRVFTGENLDEIEVENFICTRDKSPCYYPSFHSKHNYVERCIEQPIGKERNVKICDDRVLGFSETISKPSIKLRDASQLEVEFDLSDDGKLMFQTEVVVFDFDDPKIIYSDKGYKCLIETGVETENPQSVTCLHSFNEPEDKKHFMVLVVKHDEKGNVISSSLEHFGDYDEPKKQNNTGVIIGAVFGTIIGVALLAFLIIFLLKKKKSNSKYDSGRYTYNAASQEDRIETNTENEVETGGNSGSD